MVAGGETHNHTGLSELVEHLPKAEAVIADKVYGSEMIREQIKFKGADAVIPIKSNSGIGKLQVLDF